MPKISDRVLSHTPFLTNISYTFLIPLMRTVYLVHLIRTDFVILV